MPFSPIPIALLVIVGATLVQATAEMMDPAWVTENAPTAAAPQLLWAINQTWVLSAVSSQDGEVVILYHGPNGGSTAKLGCYRAADGYLFWEKTNLPARADSTLLFDHAASQLFIYRNNQLVLLDSRNGNAVYSIPFDFSANIHPQFTSDRIMLINGSETLAVMDRSSGVLLWKHEFTGRSSGLGSLALASIAGDLNIVIAAGGAKGALMAFDLNNGTVLWEKTGLGTPFGRVSATFYDGGALAYVHIFVPPRHQEHYYYWIVDVHTGAILQNATCLYVNDTSCAIIDSSGDGMANISFVDVASWSITAQLTISTGSNSCPMLYTNHSMLVPRNKGTTSYNVQSGAVQWQTTNQDNYVNNCPTLVSASYIIEGDGITASILRVINAETGASCFAIDGLSSFQFLANTKYLYVYDDHIVTQKYNDFRVFRMFC